MNDFDANHAITNSNMLQIERDIAEYTVPKPASHPKDPRSFHKQIMIDQILHCRVMLDALKKEEHTKMQATEKLQQSINFVRQENNRVEAVVYKVKEDIGRTEKAIDQVNRVS